jgi:fluoroquinolone transport system permease protein
MIQLIHFRNDIKRILRDPIMAMMLIAPLLLLTAFKLMVLLLIPFIHAKTGFDVLPYSQYILAFVLITSSGMLGIVTGFMMIDERDGNIAELMSVTPLGRSGYLINRLLFASMLSVVYAILTCSVMMPGTLPLFSILFLSVLSAFYAAIIGLLIFSGADDKVKGLTFAKALNALAIFAFADLLPLQWFMVLSWYFPTFWITQLIKSPDSLLVNFFAFAVHLVWLYVLIFRYWRKKS